MRIATYNVEWFTELFDNSDHLREDTRMSGREEISREDQITALGIVFERIDADIVMIIEAPDQSHRRDTVVALERFAERFGLRTSKALIGFANTTQQEIAVLYDPNKLSVSHDPIGVETSEPRHNGNTRFDGEFFDDASDEMVTFSKPPLELAVKTDSGFVFRMIGVHLKSKAPHGARSARQVRRISIANRKKQQAQAAWLRHRIEQHLAAEESLIVLGDLNDGPGLDNDEYNLGRSTVEIVMGLGIKDRAVGVKETLFDPHAVDGLSSKLGPIRPTSRFYIEEKRHYIQALLDYIMVSQDLMAKRPVWQIWHPFDMPECLEDTTMRTALLVASDHFPVTLDIEL